MPTSKEFAQQIKTKYPQYSSVPDEGLVQRMVAKYPVYKGKITDFQEHAFNPLLNTNAQQNSEAITKGTSQNTKANFARALPGAALQVGVGSPVKLLTSVGEGIVSTITGKSNTGATGKVYDVPGLAPFKSFQSEAAERAARGQNPLLNVAQGAFDTGVAGADTIGLAKGVTKVPSVLKSVKATQTAKTAVKAEKAAGKIVQGATEDIQPAQQALSKVDASKVKTYADLESQLAESEKALVQAKGQALSTDKRAYKLSDLSTKVKSKSGLETSHNWVDDAIKQLDKHYAKTNNVAAKTELQALKAKAANQGLTVKEIDDLAVRHGQDLNAYNKSGDLAAAISKQEFENTRAGLKETGRKLFGNDAYKAADSELSAVINTRQLAAEMAEKVNKLQQTIQKRGLGEKIGRLVGGTINFFSGGAAKGMIEFFLGRGTGLKTMNAIDLEKNLQKNLKLLQKALRPGASEKTIIDTLTEIAKPSGPVVPKPKPLSINDTLNEVTPGLSSKNVNPKAEELGHKINELNRQYVNNPTASKKKALDQAQQAYRIAIKTGGTAATALGVAATTRN